MSGELNGMVVHSIFLRIKELLDGVGMFCTKEEEVRLPVVADVVPMLTVVLLDLAPGLRVDMRTGRLVPSAYFLAEALLFCLLPSTVSTEVGVSPVVGAAVTGGENWSA